MDFKEMTCSLRWSWSALVQSLMRSSAAAWDSESYSRPTQSADRAQMIFQGPPSAPRISMNFFSLISGKMVDRWFSQSFRLGFSPAKIGTA